MGSVPIDIVRAMVLRRAHTSEVFTTIAMGYPVQNQVSVSLLQQWIVGMLCVCSIVSRVRVSMRLNGFSNPTPPSCAVAPDQDAALAAAAAVLAGISKEACGQRGEVIPVKQ
jgi:hypothetical protein